MEQRSRGFARFMQKSQNGTAFSRISGSTVRGMRDFGGICGILLYEVKDSKENQFIDKDDHLHLWFPLLAGLSELTFDLRPQIRKSSLEVLFETLCNHDHHFTLPLWERRFDSVLFPIFDYVRYIIDPSGVDPHEHRCGVDVAEHDQVVWLYETCTLALQLVVDMF